MEQIQPKTVAQWVTENIHTAHVFKKYGIDFCCGGGVSIRKACEKGGVNEEQLLEDLFAVGNGSTRRNQYDQWSLDFLTDHIIHVHHAYTEENIPLLLQYAERVAKVHGHHYLELLHIKDLVRKVSGELSAHMKKEELILFPFIKKLVKCQKEGLPAPAAHFGNIDNPIRMMEAEHEDAGEIFRQIFQLSDGYTPPSGACNTYRAFYAKLQEFEEDLHHHVHLENNILFPKALVLQKQLER